MHHYPAMTLLFRLHAHAHCLFLLNLLLFPFFPDATIKIAPCYMQILADPSLQWLFLEGEWRSTCKLPILGSLQFQIVSEWLFTCLSSPSMWEQARGDVIWSSSWKISGNIVPMAVLITNRVEEGSLGMMTTFCLHDQAKVEYWKCGGGEDFCQLTLPPSGIFWLPLPGCNCSSRGHISCQFP